VNVTKPDVVATQQVDDLVELARRALETASPERAGSSEERLQARELLVAELPEPLGRRKVLQPVLAEVTKVLVGGEVARRLRHEHLSTVPAAAIRAAR
jgi:hypothetical protein